VALVAMVLEIRHRARGSAAVGPSDAVLLANQGALMLDVRTDEQYAEGHIIDARHLKNADLASSVDTLKKYKEKPVVVYCDTGSTSAAAARLLKSQGFAKVVNLRGGVQAWKQDNLPLVKDTTKGNGRSQAAKSDKGAKTA
jgi:rhodanese-related sulfurtransferase